MADVFISYNRQDQHRARGVADGLEAEGLSVWWDTNLRAGQSYDEVTEKNLRDAGAVVVLWSSQSVNSKWVRAEATIGERVSTLVPAMIEECERPLRFELVQTADLTNWHGDRSDPHWRAFITDIKSAVGHAAPHAPSPTLAGPGASAQPDATIENTFWTSIKDGNDRSDFEAYLKRYPHGHFVDLAQNRIAALERSEQAEAEATRAAQVEAERERAERRQAEEARAAELAAAQAREEAREAARADQEHAGVRRAAAQAGTEPRAQHAAAAHPAPQSTEKSGAPLGLIAAAIAALIIFGGAVFFLMNRSSSPDAARDIAAATPAASVEPETAENEPPAAENSSAEETRPAEEDSSPGDDAEARLEQLMETADVVADSATAEPEITTAAASNETPPEIETDPVDPSAPFTDCGSCPMMTPIAAGAFIMGSPDSEAGRYPYEGPQREVSVRAFALSTHEVTIDQWNACASAGVCQPRSGGGGDHPVASVSWNDVQEYIRWLSNETGRAYRLPSEAEWEYAARAGSQSAYWWGDQFDGSRVVIGSTAPATSLQKNNFGLYGVLGNVSEWVEDCYVNSYRDAPGASDAVLAGDCGRRVVRGGGWRSDARSLRLANRSRISRNQADRSLGFRVAVTLAK